MYRALIGGDSLSPMVATVPGYVAKASLVLPSLSSLFGNTDINSKLYIFNSRSDNENIEIMVRVFISTSHHKYMKL